jgi:hypothetical protein
MSGVANELFLKCQRHCEPLAFVMEEGDDVKRKEGVRVGSSPVLAERAHHNKMDQPGQSLCSRKAAHQTNRIFRKAVLLHARTFGLTQAAPWEMNERAWVSARPGVRGVGRVRIVRAVGDQSSPAPDHSSLITLHSSPNCNV